MTASHPRKLRLGVNIDHVATIRNARGGVHPSPLTAALQAEAAGADGVTAHLREDRRHIQDDDMAAIKAGISVPLNFELAATTEMIAMALSVRPNAACIVPEKREELTTEGGLAVVGHEARLAPFITRLKAASVRVSLFVDAIPAELEASAALGADIVELHTGAYCDSGGEERAAHLKLIRDGAHYAEQLGLEVHAGHGLNYENVSDIAALRQMTELNIGHFLIGAAVFSGLPDALSTMRRLMDDARAKDIA